MGRRARQTPTTRRPGPALVALPQDATGAKLTDRSPLTANRGRQRKQSDDRWPGLAMRHLRTFHAVAEEGSFSRAAAELGYTQSAVSHQIAALERIVGVRLVERTGGRRTVTLTEAGKALFRHVEQLVRTLAAAEVDVQRVVERETALRIATFESVAVKILPTIMRHFSLAFPQLRIELVQRSSRRELLSDVEFGAVDLAFVVLPVQGAGIASVELLSDPFVVLVPAEWPLAKARAPLGTGDLAGVPLVTVEDALTPTSLRPELLDRDAAARSLADNSTAQALVAAGITLAFIPRLAVERGYASEWAELEVSVPARRIGIVWRSDRTLSRSERHFVDLARRFCSAHASEPAHSAPSLAAAFSAEASDERAG